MKKGTLKTILFAALACIFMGGALLAGKFRGGGGKWKRQGTGLQ